MNKTAKIGKIIAAVFFFEGVQKEQIQQWWQARTRPGENETHNIKLRETFKKRSAATKYGIQGGPYEKSS